MQREITTQLLTSMVLDSVGLEKNVADDKQFCEGCHSCIVPCGQERKHRREEMEFLVENWIVLLNLTSTFILVGIGWFKINEVKELKETLEKQIWSNLSLSAAYRKSQARCDDLTIIVETLEDEVELLEEEVVNLVGKVDS